MDRYRTYFDENGIAHLTCPVCDNDDCDGHEGFIVVITEKKEKK